MKILLIALAIFSLTACSFRGWDPPNYGQSLYCPGGAGEGRGAVSLPRIPLVQSGEVKA